jgi:sortase A
MIRQLLRHLSTVLIVSGILLLLDAGLTVAYQEPVSGIYNHFQQNKLAGDFEELSDVPPTELEQQALASLPDDTARVAFAARALDRKIEAGDAIGRIKIPRVGLEKVIIEGTESSDLQQGPGHYADTPMPGAPGTVAIAGHRTTYGAPFRQLDKLRKGDPIELEMPYATVSYEVIDTKIVPPSATYVTARKSFDQLVLTACHPLYSAKQRIVVFARETAVEPGKSLS